MASWSSDSAAVKLASLAFSSRSAEITGCRQNTRTIMDKAIIVLYLISSPVGNMG